jgi:hypothetical protein
MTGLVAFVGAGFQYQWNQVKAERAAFQVEKAQSDLARLEEAKVELTRSLDALTRNIDALEAENEKVSVRLSDTRAQLAKAQEGIRLAAASATSPEVKQALTQAQGTVANLAVVTSESEQARKEQASRLQTIRSDVLEVRSGEILMGSRR